MSDRQLRGLLREAQQGNVALTDYVAAALRMKAVEEVIEDLNGFAVEDIRLAVKQVWVPIFAIHNPERKIAADSVELIDQYYIKHRLLLTPIEWRLLGLDYAKHAIRLFKYSKQSRVAIDVVSKAIEDYTNGEISAEGMQALRNSAWNILMGTVRGQAARYAVNSLLAAGVTQFANHSERFHPILPARNAGISARVAVGYSDYEGDEAAWQRERLIDYLLGLSALPWPVVDE